MRNSKLLHGAGVVAVSAFALAACGAIQPARMQVPEPLRAATPLAVEGMGGGTRGEFRVGAYSGQYTRTATRLAIFDDLAVFDRGSSRYTLHGFGDAPMQARCAFRQTTMTIGIVGFEPKKLAYECDYDRQGKAAPVRFTLQESRSGVRTLRAERRGRIDYYGATLAFRSVHELEGSAWPLDTPIGYVFEVDGRPVGAIELNGLTPRLWLPPDAGDVQRAAVIAAMALAIFWDPAQRS